jgi:toxin FitB
LRARWLLDTCVLSELARPRPDDGVKRWLAAHVAQCRIGAVSLGEIAYGIERLPHGARRNGLQRWADELLLQFAARVLVTDARVWLTFGRLKASLHDMGRPQDDLDVIVAATATANGLALVTRNLRHFKDTGLELLDPWK